MVCCALQSGPDVATAVNFVVDVVPYPQCRYSDIQRPGSVTVTETRGVVFTAVTGA